MRSTLRLATIGLVATLATVELLATERNWLKYHQMIEMDGVTLAEYTVIQTHDDQSPSLQRVLYKDQQGVLLILRNEQVFAGIPTSPTLVSSEISVTSVDSGEQVRIVVNSDRQVALSIGSGFLNYDDNETIPSSVRQQATQLLASHTTQPFRSALTRLAIAVSSYTPQHQSLGFALRGLFFQTVTQTTPSDFTTDATAVIKHFDPAVNAASAFEMPFGSAYQQ